MDRFVHPLARSVIAVVLVALLSGCAAVVVGGAVATGVAVHDRRTVGTVIDDNVLEVRVRNALYVDEQLDQRSRIKVNVFNGWVLLAGEVPSEALIELATERVSAVDGVVRLFNELAATERASLGEASNDRWISSRVNAGFARIRGLSGFDPSRVQVTTARSIVYLQGLVSQAESDAVIERARTVRGVERVVTLFEIRDRDE